jgi:hypothetical protein
MNKELKYCDQVAHEMEVKWEMDRVPDQVQNPLGKLFNAPLQILGEVPGEDDLCQRTPDKRSPGPRRHSYYVVPHPEHPADSTSGLGRNMGSIIPDRLSTGRWSA